MSVVDNTPRGKATGVSPWYVVYNAGLLKTSFAQTQIVEM